VGLATCRSTAPQRRWRLDGRRPSGVTRARRTAGPASRSRGRGGASAAAAPTLPATHLARQEASADQTSEAEARHPVRPHHLGRRPGADRRRDFHAARLHGPYVVGHPGRFRQGRGGPVAGPAEAGRQHHGVLRRPVRRSRRDRRGTRRSRVRRAICVNARQSHPREGARAFSVALRLATGRFRGPADPGHVLRRRRNDRRSR
jgi:hypothetical protein